jgi:hypothetical protein
MASPSQGWVEPPGTPAIGQAYLAGWQATGDEYILAAAVEAAHALVATQLVSGGWYHWIDARDASTLDDAITQSALAFLIGVDCALGGTDAAVGEGALHRACRAAGRLCRAGARSSRARARLGPLRTSSRGRYCRW